MKVVRTLVSKYNSFQSSDLIQLTGRGNFSGVYEKIKYVWSESILTDNGAEKVRTNLELAVLTSIGYFLMKLHFMGINLLMER